ncbi:MAG TPA: hypothetical protein VH414_21585 [Lichenihabitans sp.]|jgi:hypothetical protein|nr:hypothetical protein [Lichenihabitans sp.]
MRNALFSDVVMLERSRAAPGRPRITPKTDAITASLVEVLIEALTHDPPIFPETGIVPEALAQAFADVLAGRSVILRLSADLPDDRRTTVRSFLETVIRVTDGLEKGRREDAIAKLADIILPDALADARGVLAEDNLALRDRFIAETAPLTSVDVGRQAGHARSNPYATAARWKKTGDIFSVHHRGVEYFPAFQFRDGRPHPVVKPVLEVLPSQFSPWQRAFWFVSANGWLDDRAPADLLDNREDLVAAAQREGEEAVG